MLNATEDIVLFNARIGSDRREIFLPTLIRAVCLYGEKGSSGEQGKKSPTEKYTIRIPFDAIADDGKTYIEAERFRLLDDTEVKKHWTIQIGDYVASNALYPSEIWKWDSFSLCGGHIVDEMRGEPLSGDSARFPRWQKKLVLKSVPSAKNTVPPVWQTVSSAAMLA